jgi:hypothetical protein
MKPDESPGGASCLTNASRSYELAYCFRKRRRHPDQTTNYLLGPTACLALFFSASMAAG